jgi:hypothetical protein
MATFLICHGAWSSAWAWSQGASVLPEKWEPVFRSEAHSNQRDRGFPRFNEERKDSYVTAPQELARVLDRLARC